MTHHDGLPQPTETHSGPVKWFDQGKGFGFVLLGRPGRDAFLHVTALRKGGFESVTQGDRVTCTIEAGPRGLHVARVLAVETAAVHGPAAADSTDSVEGEDGGHSTVTAGVPPVQLVGRVKFFDLERGYGFVRSEDGAEVFVGSKLLKRLGLAPLRAQQAVRVSAVPGAHGLVAETLTFIP